MDGVYGVRQGAIYTSNYRYAEERMMRMLAGWIALTPQIEVKLERRAGFMKTRCMPTHSASGCPNCAQITSKPPNAEFVTFMNAIEDKKEWEDTIERLVGIYRLLKPHLISHYSSARRDHQSPGAAGRGREAARRAHYWTKTRLSGPASKPFTLQLRMGAEWRSMAHLGSDEPLRCAIRIHQEGDSQ